MSSGRVPEDRPGIAIVGMSGRFPGAADPGELWRNLRDGVESISTLSDEELAASGVAPALLANPRYVRAGGVVDGIDRFDARFFGFSRREAELLDPQHRLFLEACWQALEDAGCDPGRFPGRIGVFAGAGLPVYLLRHVEPRLGSAEWAEAYQAAIGNDKDFLTTRVSYKLDLRGPSLSVQTACSTSLVAVCLACQSLLARECDAALAGGVTLRLPQAAGYLYQEEGILSPDGHCRAFDAGARGTVPGSGCGVVVLKLLEDALAAGDPVRAVVRGWAMNNDGAGKAGYTAPRAEGQAEAILEALAVAGFDPETLGYVEAHGTGTLLGDPVEVTALAQAFRAAGARRRGFCALGSVKTNIGHLDAAAGVAGLIKTVLALEHRQIPPSLHFARPNPQLGIEESPFYVAGALADWPERGGPRRAGVSSFGIGGTNAHVVLEEAPSQEDVREDAAGSDTPGPHLFVLSARTESALTTAEANLARHLEKHPELGAADVAFTLQAGRRPLEHRRALVGRDLAEAAALLAAPDPRRSWASHVEPGHRPVAFLFPGQGAQHAGMGAELYRRLPAFRREVDRCADHLAPRLGLDLRRAVFAPGPETDPDATALAQPALFTIEIALARWWIEHGVEPEALLGHSVGELAAACLAGVFSLEDALDLVAERGRLVSELPRGAMLSVPLPEDELAPLLPGGACLAAVNAPGLCAATGTVEAIEELARRLTARGTEARRLHTSHAFHSQMMEPALAPFRARVAAVRLLPPRIPFLSNVTGTWITDDEATDPGYWARHLRAPVRFSAAVAELLAEPRRVLLQAGPGDAAAALARRHPGARERVIVHSLPHPQDPAGEAETLLGAAARLWLAGVPLEPLALGDPRARKVSLPTYPFERERYWIEGIEAGPAAAPAPSGRIRREPDLVDGFYVPTWQRTPAADALAGARTESWSSPAGGPTRWIGVDWEGWEAPVDSTAGMALGRLQSELTTAPGAVGEALERTLGRDGGPHIAGEPRLVVAGALAPRIARPAARMDRLDLAPEPRAACPERPGSAASVPRPPAEELLASLWSELLGVEQVGPDDDFFALGGHSLLAMRLIARLRESLGVELSLRTLFEASTLERLAVRVEAAGCGELPPLLPAPADGDLPLSFAQERLWFLDRLEPGSSAYAVPVAARLTGALAVPALAAALTEVVRRHQVLRTTYPDRTGRPVQRIGAAGPVPLPLVDLSGLDAGRAEEAALARGRAEATALALAGEEAARPFDLAAGPVLRASLLQTGAAEHLLVVDVHHIATDGWSTGVLVEELAALYGAFSKGRPSPLPAPPAQYADFAAWQRSWLSGEVLEGQLGYWRARLAGLPALELPTDRPRGTLPRRRGAVRALAVGAGPWEAALALARSERATAFMVLLTAFAAVLARWSGQEDFAVGSPIANRRQAQAEKVIGLFVNTLALRVEPEGGASGREALARTARTCLSAYAHQDLPFERLVEELSPVRDLARPPLVQVMLALQNAPLPALELPGLTLAPVELPVQTAKLDLLLSLREGAGEAGGLAGGLEYDRDLFDGATAERLARHVGSLLAALSAEPDRRLAELPLLAAPEAHQLLVEWNATATPYPAGCCVHELFEQQAARTPHAVALVDGGDHLSYAGLDQAANRLAGWLRAAGAGPEVRVGVCLERSAAYAIAILAVLKAGGAYLPLDPSYPAERLALLLADSRSAVLLTEERLLSCLPRPLPSGVGRVLRLDRDAAEVRRAGAGPIRSGALPDSLPDNLAYVMYTSGSTGRPKGVAVPHRGVARLVRETGWAAMDAGEVFLMLTPLSFDVSTFEIWGALANGGRLAVLAGRGVPIGRYSSPARRAKSAGDSDVSATELPDETLGEAIRRHGVTTLWLSAGLFHQVVDLDPAALGPLYQLVAGGDALSAPHALRALANLPRGRLIDGYGPTENTTFTATCALEAPDEVGSAVPIGRPIANTTVHLVSRQGVATPLGVPGELWTGGAGLARGYLDRPDLTAERFVPDPFGPPGARAYRTGDLARRRPDGLLEFLGRLDQQVKVRGFRVELGEVEAALAAHPAVAGCAVVAPADAVGGRRLAAFWVPRPGVDPTAATPETPETTAELRRFLAARLPEFMVPARLTALPALPLGPTGKVDRRALLSAAAAPARSASAAPPAAPRSPVEELLAGIWSDLLGVDRPGVDADFFELGGHSLLATQLASRVRDAFGCELPLRRFFERRTIASLAAAIEAEGRNEAATLPPVAPAGLPAGAPVPLSFAQERLWILDRIEPGSAAYNIPLALTLAGTLAVAPLARALGEVVRRHGALRTRFAERGGRPVQVVEPPAPAGAMALPLVDLAGLPPAPREAEAARLAAAESASPFDLARGPLLRATLLRLAQEKCRLLLTFHHVVTDGWSLGVLVRELAALYGAFLRGELSPLPPLPVQYADYAAWERRWRTPEALSGALGYWRERLADLPPLELPTDRPRRAVRTYRGDRRALVLGEELSGRLRSLARRRGATLFMTLLAGFAVVLSRLGGEEDFAVGTPVAGRLRAEVEGLIGMFLNTLVLRLDLAGDPTFEELSGRVRETALGAFAHQEVPFEMLLEALQPERELSRTPLFQVFFNLLNFPLPEVALPGVTLAEAEVPEVPAKFELTAYVRERGERIGVDLVYNADLFDGARIEELLAQLATVLEQAADRPDRAVGELSLLTLEAQAALPDPRVPLDATWHGAVHELFSRRARADSERWAVVDRDGAWTYGEVEAESNRLAWRLAAAGLRPGEPVAIYAHRSAALAWAVLGVLKAGGAFVLLDPAYPAARLVEIVRLARVGAWVQLDAAGAPAPELAAHVEAALPAGRRIVLPPRSLPGEDVPVAPPVAVGPDDVACLAFTSGSTGLPKGILGRHGPLSHFLPWMADFYGLSAEDRFSLLSALAHDPLQRDIFTPLCLGARLCVPDPAELLVPGRLAAWMRREGVTVANLTPAMAQVLAEQAQQAAPEEPALADLRYVFLVGDVLTRGTVARLRRMAPQVTCINHYGSTETQRAVGFHVIPPGEGEDDESREVLPLGRGIPDVQLLVLSRGRERLAGIGEVGEIALRSPHLAAGYLGDDERTRERFRRNPFTGKAGDRIYLTGDLGRYLPDGEVTFAGRADQQVKVRGFRIELSEIEGRLARLPGVREAVVLPREERPGDRRLVAWVVPEAPAPEGPPAAAELRARLAAELPAYMVPASVNLLERLPLSANGKVDRRALLRLDAGPASQAAYREPATDLERRIVALLAEVLGARRVGADDNFFDLGGNSLLLVQLHGRLEQALEREVPMIALFSHPTAVALARHLAAEGDEVPAMAVPDRSEKLLAGRRLLRRRRDQRRQA